RAGDAAGDVEVGRDLRAGLADLVGVRAPACARDHARATDTRTQQPGELLDDREAFAGADAAPAADHDLRLRQRHAATWRVDVLSDLDEQVARVEVIEIPPGVHLRRRGAVGDADRVGRDGEQRPRSAERRRFQEAATPALARHLHWIAWF